MSIYLSYNDDTLAAFANMGLLRRAKKSLDDVTTVDISKMTFESEGFVVTLPKDGIQKASCTCPTHKCCKHILASVLYFQAHHATTQTDNTNQTNPNTPNHQEVSPTTPTPTALEELLSHDPKTLQKSFKKADRRLAYAIYQDLPKNNINITDTSDKLTIVINDTPVYYFKGLSIDGMVSELPNKQRQAYHLSLIATLFDRHHTDWQWMDDITEAHSAPILNDDELVFVTALQQLCVNFLKQGLSHLAKPSVMSLHLFGIQARTYAMPRLAGIIRRLYGNMTALDDDIHDRAGVVFDDLAVLYHYLQSLLNRHRAGDSEQLSQMRGKVTKDYDDITLAKLIPLGASWWTTKSGSQGLDFCFWDCESNVLRQVTNGRANTLDTTFSSHTAYRTGIWGASVDYLSQHIITLTHAKIAPSGNLSPSELTRYRELGKFDKLSPAEFRTAVTGIDDWQMLYHIIRPTSRLFLQFPSYVLLHPQDVGVMELDEIDQCFYATATDKIGNTLALSLPVQASYENRLRYFDFWARQGQIIAILAYVSIQDNAVSFIPTALIINEPSGIQVFNLDFDYVRTKKAGLGELIAGRISELLKQKQQKATPAVQADNLSLAISQSLSLLDFYAKTGRVLGTDDKDTLQSLALYFKNMGLMLVSDAMDELCADNTSDHQQKIALLKVRYLLGLLQLQRMSLPIALA